MQTFSTGRLSPSLDEFFGPVSQPVKQVTTREFRVQQTVPAGVFEQRAPYSPLLAKTEAKKL